MWQAEDGQGNYPRARVRAELRQLKLERDALTRALHETPPKAASDLRVDSEAVGDAADAVGESGLL